MRTIKFRGKHFKTGEWLYGYLYESNTEYGRILFINSQQIDPETVGQFIGLRDKNGKRIYEGDIILEHFLESDFENPADALEISVVSFKQGAFGFKSNDDNWQSFIEYPLMQCKIIGNIYDNPELLK